MSEKTERAELMEQPADPAGPARRRTMRAAVADRFGGPEVVRVAEVARPEPGPGELLVRVRASTVSIADHRMRARDVPRGLGLLVAPTIGLFRPRKHVLGMEAAGVVESIGAGVTRFAPGDEVMLARTHGFGCHAEYVTVAEDGQVASKPGNLSFEAAAAVIFGGITALRYLGAVAIGPGTDVLVNGASGAVGTSAVQLAAALGATVTAVTSGPNADLVRSLGAHRVVDYRTEDFAAPGAARYDVVVECVGNAPFERVAQAIRPGGALLLVILDLKGMLTARRNARRSGIAIERDGVELPGGGMERLAELAADGVLRPVIDRTFDLDGVVAAHRYVDTGRKRGSVVLRVA